MAPPSWTQRWQRVCLTCPALPRDPADSRSPAQAGPGGAAGGGQPLMTGQLQNGRSQRSSQLLSPGQT